MKTAKAHNAQLTGTLEIIERMRKNGPEYWYESTAPPSRSIVFCRRMKNGKIKRQILTEEESANLAKESTVRNAQNYKPKIHP